MPQDAGGLDLDTPGLAIENPSSGERIVVRQTAEDTNGELLAFDLLLPPGGCVPAWHSHPGQEERFTILRGRLRFWLRQRTLLAQPGDVVRVPPRTAHWFGNPGPHAAEARVEVRPALRMQQLFEETAALHRRAGERRPGRAALARLLLTFSGEVAVPLVPTFLARALLSAVALGQPGCGEAS